MAEARRHPGSLVLLTRISRFVYRQATPEVLGMTALQFIALTNLRHREGLSQSDLAAALMVDANRTVLLLNEFEGRGWALRRRDPADRRRHIVEITPEGLSALEHAEDALETTESEVLSRLSAKERTQLRDLLDKALDGAVIPDDPTPRTDVSI